MAWDEGKKNTLARHAAIYPDYWFGIWSGPGAYNSVLSKSPGSAGPDFPVMNMHPHAWPLYSAAKLLGLEFHRRGLSFRPDIPVDEYEFSSRLLGFRRFNGGYSGWYDPAAPGQWIVEWTLPKAEHDRVAEVNVNGKKLPLQDQVCVLQEKANPEHHCAGRSS